MPQVLIKNLDIKKCFFTSIACVFSPGQLHQILSHIEDLQEINARVFQVVVKKLVIEFNKRNTWSFYTDPHGNHIGIKKFPNRQDYFYMQTKNKLSHRHCLMIC